jgi:hypothetical protein
MTDTDTAPTVETSVAPGPMFPLTPAPPAFPFTTPHIDPVPPLAPGVPPTESATGMKDGELGAGPTGQLFKVSAGKWVRVSEPDDDLAADELGPVSSASADDTKKRLAAGTLFRNGIVSYRIPQFDAGHISRGVKYAYITEDMIVPATVVLPGDGTASGTAIAATAAAATVNRNALYAAIAAGTALPLRADNSVFEQNDAVKAPVADEISEAVMILLEAKSALAANSLSNVGYYIGRAIQILEG